MSVDRIARVTAAGRGPGQGAMATLDLSLRPAAMEDAPILWQWRNDDQTRAMSRHSGVIPWEMHTAWLTNRLADSDAMILIGLRAGEPIGMVRLDRRLDGAAEVSINIAADVRGRGLGKRLLQRGCEHADRVGFARVFDAEIMADNFPSRKIFEGCGFRIVSSSEKWMTYRRPDPAKLDTDSK
jgi:RimJ/RimL family protein N-acetyltransferase